ncbi:hypothetical protein COK52_16745 [Bacillus thuringiensis]|uniref:hypothetical protein n=1 Tax=Bacillus cereus group TaxID=86661 RepID=UPI000BFA2577|nr:MULTISPECIES: hypothetical protein [unclassified Bacillus cereus group]MDA2218773.1 hypothetical protein [Bacillus cereus group sp. Bc228]MDA2230172.1 hypothetical protein [Bacillus cereus group sp. Bc227]PFT22406.1 hypothetical protein COK52_16745 [Bacillus thuringiensis]
MIKPTPIACLKKAEDGSEVIVRKFATYTEARKWSMENNIMCNGAIKWTLTNKTYLPKPQNHTARAKYHNRDLYRFIKIINPNEKI